MNPVVAADEDKNSSPEAQQKFIELTEAFSESCGEVAAGDTEECYFTGMSSQ